MLPWQRTPWILLRSTARSRFRKHLFSSPDIKAWLLPEVVKAARERGSFTFGIDAIPSSIFLSLKRWFHFPREPEAYLFFSPNIVSLSQLSDAIFHDKNGLSFPPWLLFSWVFSLSLTKIGAEYASGAVFFNPAPGKERLPKVFSWLFSRFARWSICAVRLVLQRVISFSWLMQICLFAYDSITIHH